METITKDFVKNQINRHIENAEKMLESFQDKIAEAELNTITMVMEASGDDVMKAETSLRNWLMVYDEMMQDNFEIFAEWLTKSVQS